MDNISERRARDWLLKGDVRPTQQRVALAQLLVGDGQDRHVCAESLFEAASETEASVSLATVYNTLKTFCNAGLLNEISIDGHKSYFDTRIDEHPHYYWESTAEVTDAPKGMVKFETLDDLPENTEISRVDVVIRLRDKR